MRVPPTKLDNGRRTIVGNPAKTTPAQVEKSRMLLNKMRVSGARFNVEADKAEKSGRDGPRLAPTNIGILDKQAGQAVRQAVCAAAMDKYSRRP